MTELYVTGHSSDRGARGPHKKNNQSVHPDGPSVRPPQKETCVAGKKEGQQSVVRSGGLSKTGPSDFQQVLF
jgi:hypothetical protein